MQTFVKRHRVGRTGDSEYHDTQGAGWKGGA